MSFLTARFFDIFSARAASHRFHKTVLTRHLLIAIFCLIVGIHGTAFAQTPYEVVFKGAPTSAINAELGKFSRLSDAKIKEAPTRAFIRRTARRDARSINDAVRASGYYAAQTTFQIEQSAPTDKTRVTFFITPGLLFEISDVKILYQDVSIDDASRPYTFNDAGADDIRSASGADLQIAQNAFVNQLLRLGYPNARSISRRVIADIDAGNATAEFTFVTGAKARFGDIKISGVNKTAPNYMRSLKTWEHGELYDRTLIVDYQDRLSEIGIFSAITIEPGAVDDTGLAPINVDVRERKRRTIGVGASFATDLGPGGRLFYENRNVFGRAENLRIDVAGSRFEQSIDFRAAKPLPSVPGRVFANFGFANETTDAFSARTIEATGGFAKQWLDRRLETSAAIGLETAKVNDDGAIERTYFVVTPLSVTFNSENDVFNPQRGFYTGLIVTPHTGSETFVQLAFDARARATFGKDDKFTLAGRTSLGGTLGNSLFALPTNKRFFAGGGGSVRGYGFQEAGPLDENGNPQGGRSLITTAIELRGQATDTIQIAAFVDAGSVASKPVPDLNQRYFVGYGAGVRYFTPIGPIRLDIALPLNGRDSDAPFQLYVALGQPF